jgi:hypothetical protein
MVTKYLSLLAIPLLLAACSRGPNTTASAAGPNPEPVAVSPEPIQATVPDQHPLAQGSGPAQANQAQPALQGPAHVASGNASQSVTIAAHTRIRVRLGETLDTKTARPGERFTAYLADPIVSDGRVVLPTGTPFEGRVIESQESGRLKGRAYLGVILDAFQYNGQKYAIDTAADVRASHSHKKRNFALIGGGSGVGAVIGAVAGGGAGAAIGAGAGAAAGLTGAVITGKKNLRLPAETPLVFSLRSAVMIRS